MGESKHVYGPEGQSEMIEEAHRDSDLSKWSLVKSEIKTLVRIVLCVGA